MAEKLSEEERLLLKRRAERKKAGPTSPPPPAVLSEEERLLLLNRQQRQRTQPAGRILLPGGIPIPETSDPIEAAAQFERALRQVTRPVPPPPPPLPPAPRPVESAPPRPPAIPFPANILGNFVVPLAKGVLRAVGLPAPVGPGEQAAAGLGETVGTMAATMWALGALGPSAVAPRLGAIASAITKSPTLALSIRSGLASGLVEGVKQAVRGLTGQESKPESVLKESAVGFAVPQVLFKAGDIAGGVVRAGIKAAKKVFPKVDFDRPVGEYIWRFGRETIGRIIGKDKYDDLSAWFAWNFRVPDRYYEGIEGQDVKRYLGLLERGTKAYIRTGTKVTKDEKGKEVVEDVLEEVFISGPKSPLGARGTAEVLEAEVKRLSKISKDLIKKGDKSAAYKVNTVIQDFKEASKNLRWFYENERAVPDEIFEDVAGRIARSIGLKLAEAGYRKPTGGLSLRGQYLAFVRQNLILAKHRPGEQAARSALAHIYIGAGNIASGIVNAIGYVNVLTREGAKWTAKSTNEVLSWGPIAKMVAKHLGYPKDILLSIGVHTVPVGKGNPTTQLISGISFYPHQQTDKLLRLIAATARYMKTIESGGTLPKALKAAMDAAREDIFDFAWNLPSFLRASGFGGSFMRLLFQFYPYVVNQANFLARLNLEELARYMGYQFAVAGAIGLPFTRVLDRGLTFIIGYSLLDRARADPDIWKKVGVEGIIPTYAGAAVGHRADFSLDLFVRWMTLHNAPFEDYAGNFTDAVELALANPTPEGLAQAVKAFLTPLMVKRALQTIEAEHVGAFLTKHGIPITDPTNPLTYDELRVAMLGFDPIRKAEARAHLNLMHQLNARDQLKKLIEMRRLRAAEMRKDAKAAWEAYRELIELGMRPVSIREEARRVHWPPALRVFKFTARGPREELEWYEELAKKRIEQRR